LSSDDEVQSESEDEGEGSGSVAGIKDIDSNGTVSSSQGGFVDDYSIHGLKGVKNSSKTTGSSDSKKAITLKKNPNISSPNLMHMVIHYQNLVKTGIISMMMNGLMMNSVMILALDKIWKIILIKVNQKKYVV